MAEKRNRTLAVTTRVIVVLLILVAAGVVYQVLVVTKPVPEVTDLRAAAQRVVAFAAEPVPIRRQWRGFGTTQSIDAADVPAQVGATVIDIPEGLRAGVAVRKGQVLVQLDRQDFERQLRAAQQNLADIEGRLAQAEVDRKAIEARLEVEQGDLEVAERELDRVQKLFADQVTSTADVDQSKRTVAAARRNVIASQQSLDTVATTAQSYKAQWSAQEATAQQAKENLARTTITSPLDGRLETLDVEVGEWVTAMSRVARVVDLRRIEAPVRLPSDARFEVTLGDTVGLRVDASSAHLWDAVVARISPTNDAATRTMTIYAVVTQDPALAAASASGLLVPGQFVEAVVTASQQESRWVVPRRSIQQDRVFLIEPGSGAGAAAGAGQPVAGQLASRQVKIDFLVQQTFEQWGLSDREWAVLVEPLPAGAVVVVNPSRSMVEGQKVEGVLGGTEAIPAKLKASHGRASGRTEAAP
ncbi:MAG: HlyD family efflux transporter periplasmic adaptor subunit [Phycisphaeraceae bacterium]